MSQPKAFGGSANLVSYLPGTNRPGQEAGIFRGAFTECVPRSIMLGGPAPAAGVGVLVWPPSEYNNTFAATWQAGLLDEAGTAPIAGQMFAACKLTYGVGPVSRTVYFDWRPGAYNLPSCSYVEVSVVLWGPAWVPSTLAAARFTAVAMPGNMDGALQPTVTATMLIPATPGFRVFEAPVSACAFDVEIVEVGGVTAIGSADAGGASTLLFRDESTGIWLPPWGPVQITPGTRQRIFGNTIDTMTVVRYWLQL